MSDPKRANISLHSASFVLTAISAAFQLTSIIYPQWAVRSNPGTEVVTSVRMTAGTFERCTYYPTGHMECIPLYTGEHQFVVAIKVMSVLALALNSIALILNLVGGNCTNCLYEEFSGGQPNPVKQKLLLGAGGCSIMNFILQLIVIILFQVEISSQTIFGSLINNLGTSGFEFDNTSSIAVITTGPSMIFGAIACGGAFLAGVAQIMGGLAKFDENNQMGDFGYQPVGNPQPIVRESTNPMENTNDSRIDKNYLYNDYDYPKEDDAEYI